MGFFFFKLPKHYVFDYKPLYYKPKKKYEKEYKQKDGEHYRPEIKFRRYINYHKQSKQKSAVMLITVLGLLILLFLIAEHFSMIEKFVNFLIKMR